MSDTILVTGGAGFIGSNLVRALLERGDHVRVLDNFSTGHSSNLTDILGDIELVEGDLRSIDACRNAMEGARFVFHQAALPSVPRSIEDPHTTHEVNATGTLHVLMAARDAGVQRVIYASSSSVYGPVPKLPREETDRTNPISPYAVSKLAGEQYCMAFWHSYGLETVALRYFNVFGPRQGWDSPYAAVLPRFVHAIDRSQRPQIFGDGEQGRDFTFIDNVVQANLKALASRAAPGNSYNVGLGERTTVNRVLEMVKQVMGAQCEPELLPPRAGDLRDSVADITRARADLGYQPDVSIVDGLRSTVAWLLNNRAG